MKPLLSVSAVMLGIFLTLYGLKLTNTFGPDVLPVVETTPTVPGFSIVTCGVILFGLGIWGYRKRLPF